MLDTQFAFEARVEVDQPLVIGESSHGLRRIVPILGGVVEGPLFSGTVVPGGADWQFVRPDGVLEVHALYTLRAHDGTLVMVDNRGMRHAPAPIMAQMARGEPVPDDSYYFRTCARLEAPLESHLAWVNRALFIGVARREPDAAVIRFYRVD